MIFKDAAGRDWLVRIDVNALRRIRDGIGVNFGDWSEIGTLLKRMHFDDLFVAEIAYFVVKPEIDSRKIDDTGFFAELYGDAIARAADSIQQGIVDFFRHPAIRAGVKAEIEATKALTQTLLTTGYGSESTRSPEGSESTPAPSPSPS